MSMETGEQARVYEECSGTPFWMSSMVRFAAYLGLAMTVGMNLGQFIQISRYIDRGVVPAHTQTYLAEFGPDAVVGPAFAVGLILVTYRYNERIDEAFQPWIEWAFAIDNKWFEVDGPVDEDNAKLTKMVLKSIVPLVVAVPVMIVSSGGVGGRMDPAAELLAYGAMMLTVWLLWVQVRDNPPETEIRPREEI